MARSPARVEVFSDGVLAIVMTLLVFEIKIPTLSHTLSPREAWDALQLLVPRFGSFILSFAYVAVFWVNHHHFFDLVVEVRPGLLWLNHLLLLFICVVPFPTALIGAYPANPVALAFFAVILIGAGLAFTVMWHYAFRRGLMSPSLREETARDAVRHGLLGPPLYAIAAAGAFAAPWIAWSCRSHGVGEVSPLSGWD